MGNSREICRKHYAALIPEEMADVVEFGGHAIIINPARGVRLSPGLRLDDGRITLL